MRDNGFKNLRKVPFVALVAASAFAGNVGMGVAGVAGVSGAGMGVAGAQPVLPVRPGVCSPTPGAGPGYNVSIGNAQNGKQVCITVGEKLLVFLSVSPTSALKWHPVQVSPPGVLTIAPLTLMLSKNVTATNFKATHTGLAHLSSERMACSPPPKSQVACGAMVSWRATVLVRAAPQARY
jgi:hypothetical protein